LFEIGEQIFLKLWGAADVDFGGLVLDDGLNKSNIKLAINVNVCVDASKINE
jgi:hypothetical protein